MTETKKEVPVFRVTQAPGFMTGLVQHSVGAEIPWEVPDNWDAKKWGKHFAEYGPSTTFECVNKAAEELMASHKATVAKKNAPIPSDMALLLAQNKAQQDQIMQLLQTQMEANALMRRQLDAAEEATEKAKKK